MEKKFKEWLEEKELLVEMARMNVREVNGSLPHNEYDVRIWSNEHEPPHIHVCYPSRENPDYEVIFSIETGDLLKVKSNKINKKSLTDLEKTVKIWLKENNALNPKETNQQACRIEWLRTNG